jgi:hypothetical protein
MDLDGITDLDGTTGFTTLIIMEMAITIIVTTIIITEEDTLTILAD